MERLYDRLKRLEASDRYPYHMPGHKRNMAGYPMAQYYGIDITEIEGFDNLHSPSGILRGVMERADRLFGAETYLLVNGSTGGILSAVSALLRRGDTLLLARNSHKAAYHAVYLNDCRARYIYPSFLETYGICGSVFPRDADEMLARYSDIRAVFLTSPTYDGVVSDVKGVVAAAHRRHIPVIVDEAHGAHFAADGRFPASAVKCGADIVIHSVHKTLPALTQTALLHVQGDLVDRERLRRFLGIYQTSSPSYVLLAGIEQCIAVLETERTALCDRFFTWNERFMREMKKLRSLKELSADVAGEKEVGIFDFDTGKKIISARGTSISGQALYRRLLRDYRLELEMAGQDYVTAIMTIMDREEGFVRLADALAQVDRTLVLGASLPCAGQTDPPEAVCGIFEAMEQERESVLLEECCGRISADFIQIYPPGIPLIVPGERFTEEVTERLVRCREQGLMIEGMRERNRKVNIVRREIYA